MSKSPSHQTCQRCKETDALCRWYGFKIGEVLEVDHLSWNVGYSQGWSNKSSYRMIGSGGVWLCKRCRRQVLTGIMTGPLLGGVIPTLIILPALFFYAVSLDFYELPIPGWVLPVSIFVGIYVLFSGFTMLDDFLDAFFAWREQLELEAQRMQADDLSERYGTVVMGGRIPTGPGGVKLFTTSEAKRLK